MLWKEFLQSVEEDLYQKIKSDIQYRKFSQEKIKENIFSEIVTWLEFKKGIGLKEILLNFNTEISRVDQELILDFIEKRSEGIPQSYILGKGDFLDMEFKLNETTLIPRPETEELVWLAVNKIKSLKNKIDLIEVGTGSGCIITGILKTIPKKTIEKISASAIDISSEALLLAKYNFRKNINSKVKIKFIKSNLLLAIKKDLKLIGSNNTLILVANLPYVSAKEYALLSPEVRLHEPKKALLGGKDGAELINTLIDQTVNFFLGANPTKKIIFFLEASPSTIPLVKQHIKTKKYKLKLKSIKDMSGKERFIYLEN